MLSGAVQDGAEHIGDFSFIILKRRKDNPVPDVVTLAAYIKGIDGSCICYLFQGFHEYFLVKTCEQGFFQLVQSVAVIYCVADLQLISPNIIIEEITVELVQEDGIPLLLKPYRLYPLPSAVNVNYYDHREVDKDNPA